MEITADGRGAVAEQGPRLSLIRTPDQRLRVFVSSSLQELAAERRVDLSAVSEPALVPDAIASALGLVGQGRERPLDTLKRGLAGRDMPIHQQNAGTGLYGQATLSVIYAATPSREISHPDSPAITNLPMTRPPALA